MFLVGIKLFLQIFYLKAAKTEMRENSSSLDIKDKLTNPFRLAVSLNVSQQPSLKTAN